MRVSVIIPCHNEEPNIERMVNGLLDNYDGYINEVIIVDDASDDNTYLVAEGLSRRSSRIKVIRRSPPCGVGRALRDGFKAISPESDYVLTLDADFVHNIYEIKNVIEKIKEGYDCVYGSRFLKQRNIQGYPFMKLIVNRGFHFLVKILLRIPCADLTNNFKLMKRQIIDQIRWRSVNFSINAETGLYPILKGYKVVEMPVSWIQRGKGMGLSDFRVLKVAHSYTWVLIKAIALKYFPQYFYKKIFTDDNKVKMKA